MKHVMLDLETMGTSPGCAIVSIGAVQFDLATGALGRKFYCSIDVNTCIEAGLKIEGDTLMWWVKQSDYARAKLQEDPKNLAAALYQFKMFIEQNELTIVWGNSASFDCGILAACYRALKLSVPWMYIHEKCYRTIVKLFPSNQPKKDSAKAHDPIYDCEYQISVLCSTWKKITNKNFV